MTAHIHSYMLHTYSLLYLRASTYRMSCAFCYYGLVLMTTELFEGDGGDLEQSCAADCRPLQTTDYMDLLWTTLAEFPGKSLTDFTM